MKLKQFTLIITLLFSIVLVACGSKSGNSSNSTLSGTYSYKGESFYDDSKDEKLTLYYELKVNDKKSTYDVVAMDEDDQVVQHFYSETVTVDDKKQIIKDYKGHEFKYKATEKTVTLPDLNGKTGDTVTLTK
ncbi:hypothetical protein HMPREF2963_02600 [Streptococcus sp. HMSC067A03]|uniref:hypothetical protein n=1 Tax=Streptococcus sp. HMSC067A03 TaxID=1739467 RepID=UPI0008A3363D|nr:hypothetical protein [Streptococcus sp. HMSC067A03]OFP95902.1 hypothetical protein HMPREF2963_02600 [Streptococcus sp. HMSC067A03]